MSVEYKIINPSLSLKEATLKRDLFKSMLVPEQDRALLEFLPATSFLAGLTCFANGHTKAGFLSLGVCAVFTAAAALTHYLQEQFEAAERFATHLSENPAAQSDKLLIEKGDSLNSLSAAPAFE